jgi:hypothetical protein
MIISTGHDLRNLQRQSRAVCQARAPRMNEGVLVGSRRDTASESAVPRSRHRRPSRLSVGKLLARLARNFRRKRVTRRLVAVCFVPRRRNWNSATLAVLNQHLAITGANVRHERFCWAIVHGHRLGAAYEIAGFTGKSPRLPWQLRHKPCIEARVTWLLTQRIEADTKARHQADEKIEDARLRLIREFERVAYSDARDLAQWDRRPRLDNEGNLVEFVDELQVTPSRLLTRDAGALVRSVTTKSGTIKIETHDKLQAIDKLARILGVYQEPPASAAPVTVNQVNIGSNNALEAVKRLAFAIAKAQHSQALEPPTIEGNAGVAGRNE